MTPVALLELRLRQARASEAAHYRRGSILAKSNTWLTLIVTVTTAFVGSSLFALVGQRATDPWKLTLASMGLVAAVLAGLQRALNLGQEGERNRATGAKWERIFNTAVDALTETSDEQALRTALANITKSIDAVVADSPQLPQRAFYRAGLQRIYDELAAEASVATRSAALPLREPGLLGQLLGSLWRRSAKRSGSAAAGTAGPTTSGKGPHARRGPLARKSGRRADPS
jgi:hypothetical protein